jgi:hypothetical protein
MTSFSKIIFILCLVVLCFENSSALAARWAPTLENSPDLHTTTLEIDLSFNSPPPGMCVVDLTSMGESTWQAKIPTQGKTNVQARLSTKDFTCINPGNIGEGLTFGYTILVEAKDPKVQKMAVRWSGNNGTVYPWEVEPKAVAKEGAVTWWPGLHRNNAGHFGWRYEPNGLLVENISFDNFDRSAYWSPSVCPYQFRFNFSIPGAKAPERKLITKGDEKLQGITGLKERQEYEIKGNIYQNDTLDVTWTSVRWKRPMETADGKKYTQELRYSILSPGIQVETDAPALALSFQDGEKQTCSPGQILYMSQKGIVWSKDRSISFTDAAENWMILVKGNSPYIIPVMVVFSKKPDRLEWKENELIVHRTTGVGTLAMGAPFGVGITPSSSLLEKTRTFLDQFRRYRDLLTAYAWNCTEDFSVQGDRVHIRNNIDFLPWSDDWKSKPSQYAPLPPLISLGVKMGHLPADSIHKVKDMKVPTKWGPYLAAKGNRVEYSLPIPDLWDFSPLGRKPAADKAWLYKYLTDSASPGAVQDLAKVAPEPTIYPHNSAHDFVCGAWRTGFYFDPATREQLRTITQKRIQGALFPQTYRLREDPITKVPYLACTFVWNGKDTINGDGFADIDYWQGLTVYGLYTYAKYSGDWELMAANWSRIRSLMSYWEALHSWVFMSPGARESGELFHGDMPTAGYTGLIGFYNLSRRLGSAYEKDLAAYLLAKASVAMTVKFGFSPWTAQFRPEWSNQDCAGFGETWVASFKIPNPSLRKYESDDPWWLTGCIGPQSAQPEVLDLLVKVCPKDLLLFENRFMSACPDSVFKTHDDIRVMPHVMARTWLGGEMQKGAESLLKQYHSAYMLRDTHALASLLSWDIPVRLLDWSPGFVESATWDPAAGAKIQIRTTKETKVRLAVSTALKNITYQVDNQTIRPVIIKQTKQWIEVSIPLPVGSHSLIIKVQT